MPYCPGQAPIPAQVPTPKFWQFCCFYYFFWGGGFEVLRVTAYHAKFLHNKNTSRSAELTYTKAQSFWCTSDVTTSSSSFTHTHPSHVQHSSLVTRNSHTASDEHCGGLATRPRVGLLSSMIQLSPPLGWPRRSTGKTMMQVSAPWQIALHPGWVIV